MTQTYFNIKRLLVSNIGTLPLDTELSAGCDLTAAAGDGIFNFGDASGAFTTSTGTNTLSGNVVIAGTKTFATGTGAATLNGDTTVATSKTLAVTTADKLTVGGIIVPQYKDIVIPINAASVDQWAFIAKYACQVTNVSVIYTVAGGAGATVDIKKSTSVQAPASGTTMLDAVVDLTATANTVYTPTLAAAAACQLASGNTIGIDLSGTLTGLVGGIVVITMMRI